MLDMLVDNERISISRKRGGSGSAVVSFAGVGLGSDGIPQQEFVRTLERMDHDQYYVIDKTRSWYNVTGSEIVERLGPLLAMNRSVFTLGNSMGGFGAIYFASRLPKCTTAVAFGPQYSVKQDIVPNEVRWRHWRKSIAEWRVPHALVDATPGVKSHVFFGRIGRDRSHARLFIDNAPEGMSIYLLAGQSHHTASYLRQMGCLIPMLELIFSGRAGGSGVRMLLRNSGVGIMKARKPVLTSPGVLQDAAS